MSTKNEKKIDETEKVSYTKQVSRKHKEKSKQRIMQAAAELFSQKGFDSTGIREICHQADANICMVSYFWGGKKALYDGIINELAEREALYAKKVINTEQDIKTLSKQELLELLYSVLDKITDFLYEGWISEDMYRFLIQEQQNGRVEVSSPLFNYVRKLTAAILEKKINDKEVIMKTLFIFSQIISPAMLPAFSLNLLNRKSFQKNDSDMIKKNVRLYAGALFE